MMMKPPRSLSGYKKSPALYRFAGLTLATVAQYDFTNNQSALLKPGGVVRMFYSTAFSVI